MLVIKMQWEVAEEGSREVRVGSVVLREDWRGTSLGGPEDLQGCDLPFFSIDRV